MPVETLTLFDEMRGFIVFFLIFGLWPAWINNKYKWLLIIHSIFSITTVFAIFASAIFIHKVLESNLLSTAVAYSCLFSILVTHLIIILQSLVQREFQLKLIQKFAHVDRSFHKKLHILISHRDEKRVLLVRFVSMLSIFAGIKVAMLINLADGGVFNSFWYYCLYSIWIARLRCVQVLCFVHLLRARLILVNDKIKEILTARNLNAGIPNVCRPISTFDNSMLNGSIYDRLLNLKQIYGELYAICELINQTYGWSLLAMIAQCFIDFTSNSYWTFLALEQTTVGVSTAINCVSLLIPIAIVLLLLCSYCSSCSRCVSDNLMPCICCKYIILSLINLNIYARRLVLWSTICIASHAIKRMNHKTI